MRTPSDLSAFIDACIPLASQGDHGTVSTLLEELINTKTFAKNMPVFADVETSDLGWTLGREHICHQTDALTVMVLDTLPGVMQPPHEHRMHAIIGVFEGQEVQRFFARTTAGISPTTGRTLEAGDVMVLGEQAIHAISSPTGAAARAIHVYFGDIYDVDRSLFHPETLEPHEFTNDRYDDFCRAPSE